MTELFQNDDNSAVSEPVTIEDKNYLEDLVGEDKKFKSVEDLAKGKAESDAFIRKLQEENEGMRQELKTRISLQEFMDKQEQMRKNESANSVPENTTSESSAETKTTNQSNFKPEDIEKLLEKKLAEREQQSNTQRNMAAVVNRLKEVWGPNYTAELRKQAREIGVGEEFLTDIARTQPSAFFKLINVEAKSNVTDAPPRSVTNSAATMGSQDGVKNMSYYNKIKEKDPNLYWSVTMQNEMHKQAQRLGEEFFN
jgi:hypothetical protein